MKTVLIIGHFWPYREGSGRIMGLAKGLNEFGWQPLILTAPLREMPDPRFRVIQTSCPHFLGFGAKLLRINQHQNTGVQLKNRLNIPEKTFRKSFMAPIYNIVRDITCYPDPYKFWMAPSVKAASNLVEDEQIDAMISVWPVTSHLIAKELKSKYNIPWVADFPDPWSQNQTYSYGYLRKPIDRRLEIKTLKNADVLTTVTMGFADDLKLLHKRDVVYTIPHGFDSDLVESTQNIDLISKFCITYTGAIYKDKQDLSKIFKATKELILSGAINPNDVEIRFYGPHAKWIEVEIEAHGLSNIAKHHGLISKAASFEKQKESQILLLLNWEDPLGKGVCPMKIYDYLAAQRPILATGGCGGDVVKILLDETGAGTYAMSVEDIKSTLSELYYEYKQKGEISYNGVPEQIDNYSYRMMARKFAEILDSV